MTNEIVLSSAASKVIESLSDKNRLIAKASLEKIAHYEINDLINSTNVLSVAKGKNYYSFRASSNIRIFFQIEDHGIIVLDIAHHKDSVTSKTFLNLFIVSIIVLAIFIYFGTAGSKYFIAVVTTNTPTSTVTPTRIFHTVGSPTTTATRTPTTTGTPPTATNTATAAPPTYTPYPTYTPFPTSTPQPTSTSTPIPLISDQVMNISGWVLGTVTSCLTSIIAFIGFISTTVLTWKKEAREAQNTKLDYQKTVLELERMRIELATMNKQKVKVRKSAK